MGKARITFDGPVCDGTQPTGGDQAQRDVEQCGTAICRGHRGSLAAAAFLQS